MHVFLYVFTYICTENMPQSENPKFGNLIMFYLIHPQMFGSLVRKK